MLDQNLFLYTFTGHKSFKTQVISYVDMVFANIQIINPNNLLKLRFNVGWQKKK